LKKEGRAGDRQKKNIPKRVARKAKKHSLRKKGRGQTYPYPRIRQEVKKKVRTQGEELPKRKKTNVDQAGPPNAKRTNKFTDVFETGKYSLKN